jgi:hypothetical protein
MRKRQNAVLEALLRALQFLIENAALLTGVDFSAARQRLDAVIASFTTHAFDQDVGVRGAKGETAKQRQLRVKLRQQQMEPIALIARRNLRDVPEFAALQMPKPSVKGQAFLASASGMADAATIHHETLVAHGLPATFLDDFKAGVAKLASSLTNRDNSRSRRVGATKGLAVEEKNGRVVLSILDALVEQAVGSNQSLLRAWQAARLIHRGTGVTGGSAATPAPAPSTTSQAVPVPAATPAGTVATTSIPLPEDAGTPPATAA